MLSQVKSRVDLINQQMESDQAWTKTRLDDLGLPDGTCDQLVMCSDSLALGSEQVSKWVGEPD